MLRLNHEGGPESKEDDTLKEDEQRACEGREQEKGRSPLVVREFE